MGKSKGRTPKTPKPVKGSGNGGNGKDTVTGLYFDGFGPINSDTTYNQDSSTIKKLLETAGGSLPLDPSKNWSLEVEFGNPKYIVGTFLRQEPLGIVVTRQVLMGDFKFSGNKITSAYLDRIASVQYNGTVQQEFGDIEILGGAKVGQPSSVTSWVKILNSQNPTLASQFDLGPGFSEGDRNSLASFGEGRFFQEGWWNDPFTPNLI